MKEALAMYLSLGLLIGLLGITLNPLTSFADTTHKIKNQSDVLDIVSQIPSTTSVDPWHFKNLYDPETKSFFIPYHLWTGAKWDGVKSTKDCMHSAKNTWKYDNNKGRERKTKISGPVKFKNEKTGAELETWLVKMGKNAKQHYICHEKGIARVYDKRPRKNIDQYMDGIECKFPAGFGWKIGEKVDCSPNAPKVTRVEELLFDAKFNLQKMSFGYIEKKGRSAKNGDDYYEYKPEPGRVLHLKP
jgi:hypothetical protein